MRIRQAVVGWGLVIACVGSIVQAQAAHLADGTAVKVRLTAGLVSAQVTVGARVDLEIAQPVTLQGVVVIPSGSVAWGAVQDAKKGKSLRFDIEGVRLPSNQIVKLRCSPHKTNSATKDEIKVETQVGGDLGAARGTEFTAYLDQDVNVDVAGAPTPSTPAVAPAATTEPATPAPATEVTPAPATVAAPATNPETPPAAPAQPTPVETPAVAPPAPQPETPPAAPTPVAAPTAVSAPTSPPAAPVAHPALAAQPGELITVECFSEPLGADIMIDDEFHGSTPSILKLVPGNHQIEYRLMGFKPHSQSLNLTPGTGLRTVRMSLEKQP